MLTKKELIWREILFQALENKTLEFTQKALAKKFGVSLSTVFNALKVPRASGAIVVRGRGFSVRDTEKFLTIWATFRNLSKDTVYQTHFDGSALEIEGLLPPETIWTTYSAYRQKFGDSPADYDRVYVYAYANGLPELKKRFPAKKGSPNLTVLNADPLLNNYGSLAPLPQLYVDLWNAPEWYAKYFVNALRDKIF